MNRRFYKYVHRNASVITSMAAVAMALSVFLLKVGRDFTSDSAYTLVIGMTASLMGAFLAFFFARAIRFATKDEPKVFISYTHKDAEFVRKLVEGLEEIDVRPLYDQIELKVGDDIRTAVDDMIDRSDYFAFVISKNSAESAWAKKEIEQAAKREKRILPIVLDLASVPEELSGIYYADFSGDFDAGMNQLNKTFKPKKG